MVGETTSSDFPTLYGFDSAGGLYDGFIAALAGNPIRANTTGSAGIPTKEGLQSTGPANRPSVTNAGSHVAFHSPASDLATAVGVVDGNGAGDVYVRDVSAGLDLVSKNQSGGVGNAGSTFAQITPDGLRVVFESNASDLVGGDTNGATDIFVRDRAAGTTTRVSTASGGGQANGTSRFGQITPDGRYVVFQSEAPNLVPGDTNGRWDVFRKDTQTGAVELVSKSSSGQVGDNHSVRPSISDDGCRVVFHSWATNLVPGDVS